MSRLQIISISHKNLGSKKLNTYYLNDNELEDFELYIKSLDPEGYFILSTCNRQELYLDANKDLRFKIISYWKEIKAGSELTELDFRTYYGNSHTLKYIAKVAMGLLSAITGDDQIYSQIKKAFNLAREKGQISTLLERLFQQLAKINKRVINETDYKTKSISLAYQSLKHTKYVTQHIDKPSLLILGAGELAKQLVKNLVKFDFGAVTIANRTFGNAILLKKYYQKANITSLDNIEDKIADNNIVISCLGTDYNFFDKTESNDFRSLQLFVDLTRHNSKEKIDFNSIEIVDLEDMFTLLEQNQSVRTKSIPILNQIIQEEVDAYSAWITNYEQRTEGVTV